MHFYHSELPLSQGERATFEEAWRSLSDLSSLCFLDIETTGFSRRYDSVYLVGLMYHREGKIHTLQILCSGIPEEGELLSELCHHLDSFSTVVTYNGDMFDLPFLCARAKQLRIPGLETKLRAQLRSMDLMKLYRPYKAFFGFPDMKLKTLEAVLGIHRQDIFSGGQLVEVFHEYSRTDDPDLEKTLLLHNYEDIVHLQRLLLPQRQLMTLLQGEALELTLDRRSLVVDWSLPFPMSLTSSLPLFGKQTPEATYTFESGSCRFSISLPEGPSMLHYYLPNPGDYWYIPKENAIVHRSLAFELSPGETKKAKPDQCYLCRETETGEVFLACPAPETGHPRIYKEKYKTPVTYLLNSELATTIDRLTGDEKTAFLAPFLSRIIPGYPETRTLHKEG